MRVLHVVLLLSVFLAFRHADGAGWDSNMTKRCAKTTKLPASSNYYQDILECTAPNQNWTLAVESESSLGASCPGPVNQSYLINGAGSPVTINWIKHFSELGVNWTIDMKVDHITYPTAPACTGPVWTWFAFMDHVNHGGGPLPDPRLVSTSHILSYAQWAASASDGSRLIAGAQFWWGGKSHLIEIHLAQLNWGKDHAHPGVIQSKILPDGTEYVALLGSYWGLSVTPGTEKAISIPWNSLIAQVVSNGWFSPISGSAATSALFVAIEVKDRAIAELWHTNFRVFP